MEFALFEASPRPGGVIRTERTDSFLIDAGPDSFLVQKPAALELCREVGLADRLIAVEPPRSAYVLRGGALLPLPHDSILGIPTRILPLARSRLLSPVGRARMALDLMLPGRPPRGDESLASFFRRRFGPEALTYIGEPLLAGIHAGDAELLSMESLYPRLGDAERQHGSVMRGLRRTNRTRPVAGAFRSLEGGMQELVEAIIRALPHGALRCGTRASWIEGAGPFTIGLADDSRVMARAVLVAVPAFVAADLLAELDPVLSMLCREIRYTSTATVVHAYDRSAMARPLRGTGFVVPRAERDASILASTWISAKWTGRAPKNRLLLRGFVGGARDPDILEKPDDVLARAVHTDLFRILDIRDEPLFTRVYRWERANPQHDVGHRVRLDAIEARPALRHGLFLTGSAFRGVGIPDCIADGRKTATAAATLVASPPGSPIE